MKDMRQVEFVPFRFTDIVEIYSIRIDNKETTEFQEFMINFKNTDSVHLADDLSNILKSISHMFNEGIKEFYFRPEGKMKDRICALPIYTTPRKKNKNGTLRLYCIRISDKLLILGGGGEKTTQTYEEDEILSNKVQLLQSIDKELRKFEENGIDLHKELNNLTISIQ